MPFKIRPNFERKTLVIRKSYRATLAKYARKGDNDFAAALDEALRIGIDGLPSHPQLDIETAPHPVKARTGGKAKRRRATKP